MKYTYSLAVHFLLVFILHLSAENLSIFPTLKRFKYGSIPNSDLSNINCILSDVDGTLTHGPLHQSNIEIATLQSINSVLAKGILFYPATGRSRKSMNTATKGLITSIYGGINKTPGVYQQGLMVYGPCGNLIYEKFLPEDIIANVEAFCEKNSIPLLAYAGEDIYRKQPCIETDKIVSYFDPVPISFPNGLNMLCKDKIKVHKMILMTTDEIIAEIRPLLQTELQGIASITQAVPGMLEVLPFGSSKGDGVLKLLNHIGVSPENTAAFGDGENDIEMFQSVRYGIAVDNAKPLLKKAARYLTDSNADLGVANALDIIISSRNENIAPLREDMEKEYKELFYRLQQYEALLQRNEAQLGSFIDLNHQWNSQSQSEKDIITKNINVIKKIFLLETQLKI